MEPLKREKNWEPPLLSPNDPPGYVTCRTGPVELEVGDGEEDEEVEEGNGSATNARSSGWFWILFLLRDQEETRKESASDGVRVAVGNGRVVDTVKEYAETMSSGVVRPARDGETRARTARTEWEECMRSRRRTPCQQWALDALRYVCVV
jgi:hypothetical protein